MKRFWPLAVVFFIILAGILLLLLLQRTSQELPKDSAGQTPVTPVATGSPSPSARFTYVDGPVTVTHADGTEVAAQIDMTLVTGDRVATGFDEQAHVGAQAHIVFFDSTRTALDGRTTVSIDELAIDPADPKKQQVHLTLVSGRVWSRILKLLDPESRYEIDYSGTVSGVRGTAFLLSGVSNAYRMDVFDGTVATRGKTIASVPVGFSLALPNINSAPANAQPLVQPTPDDVRNDLWVRKQLQLDEAFAGQAAAARQKLGVIDDPQEISAIGNEAGPYTLNQLGEMHSGFMGVEIVSDRKEVMQVEQWQLQAFALIETPNGVQRRDITQLATWQVSDPSVITIDANGTAYMDAYEPYVEQGFPVSLVARWNDGTHEHSGQYLIHIFPIRD